MKLRCAIVDDEPLALSLLESYVNKTPFLELAGKYSSAVQAMKELPGNQIDLLFLDIQMPELNGLEFSKMVAPRTRIVFTTAFGQYAIDGYRVNALDYLLKPISYVDFLQAANKALQWFELVQKPEEVDSIFVKSDYKLVQVELKKILYIEGFKDYIKIYTEDAPKPILSLLHKCIISLFKKYKISNCFFSLHFPYENSHVYLKSNKEFPSWRSG